MNVSRRQTFKLALAGLTLPLVGAARAVQAASNRIEPEMTEDGLYRQEWFLDSFLELADDLQAATDNGKRFAIFWELKGCPYCKKMHTANLSDPKINSFIADHFDVLQLNLIGDRKVTDFDGTEMSEKQLAAKYGVRFTPTIQFFDTDPAPLADRPAKKREINRLVGYVEPQQFTAQFRFITEKAYENQDFRSYWQAQQKS